MLTRRTVLLRIAKAQMMRRIVIMVTQLMRITDLRVVGNQGNGREHCNYSIMEKKTIIAERKQWKLLHCWVLGPGFEIQRFPNKKNMVNNCIII